MSLATKTSDVLELNLIVPKAAAYAGDWYPLTLSLRRPDSWSSSVMVRNVDTTDKDLELDLDMLNRKTEIRPGEFMNLTLRLKTSQPRSVALNQISLQIHDVTDADRNKDVLLDLPRKLIDFRPAIGNEIEIRVEPICLYENDTKILVRLTHRGGTVFEDFTVNFRPADKVRAGKWTLRRPAFGPGQEETVELVVAGNRLEAVISGSAVGHRPEATHQIRIEAPRTNGASRFRFLEPRRLSVDQVTVAHKTADKLSPVPVQHEAFPLVAGNQYQISIGTQGKEVGEVLLRDVPGVIQLRHSWRENAVWFFLVDVTANELLQRPEVLFYDVKTGNETLAGEVAVCLRPAASRHWRVAGALGAALTFQGFFAVVRKFLLQEDISFADAFSDFDMKRDYNLLFLLSIPLGFILFRFLDWLQYRLRS